jgi:hypothetical protein
MLSGELIPCASVWHDPGITPCCKTLCCAANAQLSNPRSWYLESKIARIGSSLNQYCALGVSKIVLQQYRPQPDSCTAALLLLDHSSARASSVGYWRAAIQSVISGGGISALR